MTDEQKSPDPVLLAELSARLTDGRKREAISPALLAAYLEGGLEESARLEITRQLIASTEEWRNALASFDYLESLAAEAAPRDLVEAALAGPPDRVVQLRRWKPEPDEVFTLLAAASENGAQAVLCRSQSGIWTLEVFVAPNDTAKGYLLLSVHPDHRATYENRAARIFVALGNDERVLAQAVVRDGEIYTEISLAGLDLHARDAVNVTFGAPTP